jgi:hypothetical protein
MGLRSQMNIEVLMILLFAHFILLFLFTETTNLIIMKFQNCLFLDLTVFMQFPKIPCKDSISNQQI